MSMEPITVSDGQPAPQDAAIPATIDSEQRDIDGLVVRRVLPAAERRAVGPFVFFDHMGPTTYEPGTGLVVRPHPHIGLATLTYLYEGVIRHRDSLGYRQDIKPGEVNWMTAGRGIVHSERSPEEEMDRERTLMGLQVWVALPKQDEQIAPGFTHLSASSLPEQRDQGVYIKVIAGTGFGLTSRLKTCSPLFFVDIRLSANMSLPLAIDYPERAIYVVQGELSLDGRIYREGQMVVLSPEAKVTVATRKGVMFVAVGGEALDGPRYLWWNFVASDPRLIEKAKQDWQAGQFGHVPGDQEFIPLPSQ